MLSVVKLVMISYLLKDKVKVNFEFIQIEQSIWQPQDQLSYFREKNSLSLQFQKFNEILVLRYFYSVCYLVPGYTTRICGCIIIPLRVYHQSHNGRQGDDRYLTMFMLTCLE